MIDFNECASPETNECDSNAQCTNTEGSYSCQCLGGYRGDGKNCEGKYLFYVILIVALCYLSRFLNQCEGITYFHDHDFGILFRAQ